MELFRTHARICRFAIENFLGERLGDMYTTEEAILAFVQAPEEEIPLEVEQASEDMAKTDMNIGYDTGLSGLVLAYMETKS